MQQYFVGSSNLEVAFVIPESEEALTALAKTMELQSRTALFSQYYYGCLFHELLTFQLPDRHQKDYVQRKSH